MREILNISKYPTPGEAKYGTSKDKGYSDTRIQIELLDKDFKLDLGVILDFYNNYKLSTTEPKMYRVDKHMIKRNTRASMEIEGVNPESTEEDLLNHMRDKHMDAHNFIVSKDQLEVNDIWEAYLIVSNDQNFLDEKYNSKVPKGKKFRQKEIYVGRNKIDIGPGEIKENLEDLIEKYNNLTLLASNKDILDDNLELILHIGILHYLYERIHPLPDFNGRTGRLLNDWLLDKSGLGDILSYSEALRVYNDYYYMAFDFTDKTNDLTYFGLLFVYLADKMFVMNEWIEDNKQTYDDLTPTEQLVLRNFLQRPGEYGWREYKDIFQDSRKKPTILKSLNSLEEKGILTHRVSSANKKRYFLEYLNE